MANSAGIYGNQTTNLGSRVSTIRHFTKVEFETTQG